MVDDTRNMPGVGFSEAEPEMPGARYSGGEPEVEVSDVGQAEMMFANLKLGYDQVLRRIETLAGRFDALQASLDAQELADRDEGRRGRDPVANQTARASDALLSQRLKQAEDLHQQTIQMRDQAYQATLRHIEDVNAVVIKALADDLSDARVARERTWGPLTEVPEAILVDALKSAIQETGQNS